MTQAAQIVTDIHSATANGPWSFTGVSSDDETATLTAEGATVTGNYSFNFYKIGGGDAPYLNTDAGEWNFTLTNSDGWQVCEVVPPPLCGTILNCKPAEADQSPGLALSPDPTPTPGLFDGLTPMLPCGPEDPFPELHHCPSGSTSHTTG